MEISESLKTGSLAQLGKAIADKRLSKILADLGSLDGKEFVKSRRAIKIKNRSKKLHDLNTELAFLDEYTGTSLLATFYKSIQQAIDTAFTESSLSKLLAVIMTCGYFPLPYKTLLGISSANNTQKKELSDKAFNLIKSIKQQLIAHKDAPYHETKFLTEATKAAQDKNIEGFYRLILALERSGRGLHSNYILESLIVFLFYLDKDELIKQLQTYSDPFSIVYYMQEFKIDEIVSLAGEPVNNAWLSFELIRLLDKNNRNHIIPEHVIATKNQLELLYHYDKDFFKQTMHYFEGSKLVMATLGNLCSILPVDFVREVFETYFSLNVYHNRIEAHTALLNSLKTSVDSPKLKLILQEIFKIWQSFVHNLLLKENYYQFDLLLTDFGNYVKAHYSLNCTDTEIIQQMNELISAIKYLDTEWFRSKSKQITKYHWYGSMLYILSFAYREKNINDAGVAENIESLLRNKIQMIRNRTRNQEMEIDLAYENVVNTSPISY